jgi:hypothetical protein
MAKMVHERRAETLGRTMSEVGSDNVREFQTLSGRDGQSIPFFPTLILEL